MISQRLSFILLGAAGGLAAWVLTQIANEPLGALWGGRPLLGFGLFALIFFGSGLAMLGELGLRRATLAAAGLALPVTLLALWKSLGFASAEQMLSTGHVMVALCVLATIPVPFMVATRFEGRQGWSDYRVLFLESWNIVVRYAAAWLFVGVVWVVLLLSAELLKLVGMREFAEILGKPLTVWLITGTALGLGLSVVTEMSDMVSPYLLLRLLRLLLPVLLGVVIVFVAVLPLRGLTHLFGHLSAAGILSAVALAAISLISIAVDQDDQEAVHTKVLSWSTRGLALLLPVLGGLAAWAVVLRVLDYGWTPDRVVAAAGVTVVLGYSVLYALSILSGRGWMGWLRRANIGMALGVVGLGLLWLTPLISPEAMAARSQIGRFERGDADVFALPLWEMKAEWGVPGARALAALRARAAEPGQDALAARLALLERDDARWALQQDTSDGQDALARLGGALRVLPEGAQAPEELLRALLRYGRDDLAQLCAVEREDGLPACLLYLTDFLPTSPGGDAVLLQAGRGSEGIELFYEARASWVAVGRFLPPDEAGEDVDAAIRALLNGEGKLVPSGLMVLDAGGLQIGVRR